MRFRRKYLCVFLSFLCVSCLYSRTTSHPFTVTKSVKINSGSAALRINGRVNENLYNDFSDRTENYANNYDNPVINEGTVTKNETIYLHAGEEYKFSVLPAEVVSMNIRSLNEDDVDISVFEYGSEKKYTISGTDRMGLFIAFQNR